MKKSYIIILLLFCITNIAGAQVQNPVHWSQGLKKLNGNQYELHILATIDEGWHIYAQKQLPEAVALPTKISLNNEPGLILSGKPTELGKKETYIIKEAGVTNYEYAGKVDFVQRITIKPGIKEIKGTVTWQACTHKECLPPQTLNLIVPVN